MQSSVSVVVNYGNDVVGEETQGDDPLVPSQSQVGFALGPIKQAPPRAADHLVGAATGKPASAAHAHTCLRSGPRGSVVASSLGCSDAGDRLGNQPGAPLPEAPEKLQGDTKCVDESKTFSKWEDVIAEEESDGEVWSRCSSCHRFLTLGSRGHFRIVFPQIVGEYLCSACWKN